MTDLVFTAMPTKEAEAFRAGAPDAYSLMPEKAVSPGGMPCRHCLSQIDEGEAMLILAYRPFPSLQPYAETGPVFLHVQACKRYPQTAAVPPMLDSPNYIVRGYGADDRIVYGTGAVTATGEIVSRARHLLERADVAYVHVRSARNNCYQCRIDTA
ncbi:DUF1203 domain-containing protein [Agrobacterium fabrum]|uniref:DUF1203 domain-containing protein n=1 Tax=Agrobacterium fabrum TaxID=1176649 RepID=UPI000EF62A28|nr:DUF1203 domain-containing protein [Agrobacterium fabrum]AYM62000.1 hypothetical protein At12D13_08350 [Agrobacterium fabrum]NTE60104.1 DUF1203 domain-containing protein [Agrobacterium fabrum]